MSEDRVKAPRAKTGGRQKGTPNKCTTLVREAIEEAFERLGGVDGLVEWAEKNDDNRRIFYTQIWPKLARLQPLETGARKGTEPPAPAPETPKEKIRWYRPIYDPRNLLAADRTDIPAADAAGTIQGGVGRQGIGEIARSRQRPDP